MTDTFTCKIWIAGDYDVARGTVRKFCAEMGDCYAVERCDYIYTGGEESGVCVTRINYPRFTATPEEIVLRVRELAAKLCDDLYQKSYTIETPSRMEYISRVADRDA